MKKNRQASVAKDIDLTETGNFQMSGTVLESSLQEKELCQYVLKLLMGIFVTKHSNGLCYLEQ